MIGAECVEEERRALPHRRQVHRAGRREARRQALVRTGVAGDDQDVSVWSSLHAISSTSSHRGLFPRPAPISFSLPLPV